MMVSVRTLVIAVLSLSVGCGGGSHSNGDDGGAPSADANPAVDAPPPITPDDPGPADVRVAIDTSAGVHPISPFIYGHNAPDWDGRGAHLTMGRSGGNRMTAYNWENNASNAGSDYMFQNDGFLGGGDVAGEVPRSAVEAAHDHGAAQIVTIPCAGYVAADKNADGDVTNTPNYLDTRFRISVPAKGSAFAYPPDTTDDHVYQDEFVSWLEGQFPESRTDPRRTIFYALDNEPDLWASTHAEIRPDALTYAELVQRDTDYAAAIKSAAPGALVFGFVSYGWNGYTTLQNAPDGAGRDFLDVYLDAMAAAETSAGKRRVNVLDLHWYPEAQGGGVRITGQETGADVVAARLQAPRSLWDPTYSEASWIVDASTQGPIRLIPRLLDQIAAHYPGTRLAFTEYNYGGGADISGGLAQADVLGVFGRESVFAAAEWPLAADESFILGGFDLFRDFDGAGGAFGDTSVQATCDDDAAASVYASVNASDPARVVIVAINKRDTDTSAGISVRHGYQYTSAEVYQLTAAGSTPARAADLDITKVNAFVYTMPARSASVLVLRR